MNNKGSLLLNKELYDRDKVLYAVKQYNRLAAIKVIDKKTHWECRFSGCKYEPELTMKEFENYIINIENARI